MEIEAVVTDDEAWVPAVAFTDREGSPLAGTLSFPLPSFLTADEALEMVASTDRVIAWATAMKMRALARVEEGIGEESRPRQENQPVRFGGDETHALAVSEVSTACALSEGTAARWLNDAADLAASQWVVLEAVEVGEVSDAHARIVLDQARSLPAGQVDEFSRVALQCTRTRQGRLRNPSEFRACLRRLRERLHTESLAARKEAAQRERGVWFSAEPDGMCSLTARLAAEVGMAIFNGLDHHARQASARAAELEALPGAFGTFGPGDAADSGPAPDSGAAHDARTLSELRADAFAYRFLGGSGGLLDGSHELFSGADAPEAGAFHAEIVVTIPVQQVLGNGAESGETLGTAELEGYGPIDAPTARRLAALAPTWQRILTDCTTGQALGVGRTAYRPPKALRRYLNCRDRTCRFPGCTRRATACEPDHTIEWQNGGTTDPGNLAMLCPRHHAMKSIGAWSYRQLSPAGDLEWRSPLDRNYMTEPADVGRVVYPLQQPEPPPF